MTEKIKRMEANSTMFHDLTTGELNTAYDLMRKLMLSQYGEFGLEEASNVSVWELMEKIDTEKAMRFVADNAEKE